MFKLLSTSGEEKKLYLLKYFTRLQYRQLFLVNIICDRHQKLLNFQIFFSHNSVPEHETHIKFIIHCSARLVKNTT